MNRFGRAYPLNYSDFGKEPLTPLHGVGGNGNPLKSAVFMKGEEAGLGLLVAKLIKETDLQQREEVLDVALSRGMIGLGEHSPKDDPMNPVPLVYLKGPGEEYISQISPISQKSR